jgi:hypothetical protein
MKPPRVFRGEGAQMGPHSPCRRLASPGPRLCVRRCSVHWKVTSRTTISFTIVMSGPAFVTLTVRSSDPSTEHRALISCNSAFSSAFVAARSFA